MNESSEQNIEARSITCVAQHLRAATFWRHNFSRVPHNQPESKPRRNSRHRQAVELGPKLRSTGRFGGRAELRLGAWLKLTSWQMKGPLQDGLRQWSDQPKPVHRVPEKVSGDVGVAEFSDQNLLAEVLQGEFLFQLGVFKLELLLGRLLVDPVFSNLKLRIEALVIPATIACIDGVAVKKLRFD